MASPSLSTVGCLVFIETLVGGPNNVIIAARFVLRGLAFYLLMGKPDRPDMLGIWRPSQIVIGHQKIAKIVEFSWQIPASGQFVVFSRSGTYDGPPPYW